MASCPSKGSLSPARRRLLETCQQVNFGRVESLVVDGGEPALDPPPRIVREIKFGGENGPRKEIDVDDFLLKSQVVELFAFFDELKDGTIDVLEIKHGLPFRVIVTERAA
ncbi:MAG: hypothetical protein HYS13_05495 [Planctomycetia bacterium]|nr:hypothetical protein [Planctomycetia bacterium]